MVEDDPAGPFTVRATNPKLDPPEVIEVCHSKSAMQTRAGRLYKAGYEVEVIKPDRANAGDANEPECATAHELKSAFGPNTSCRPGPEMSAIRGDRDITNPTRLTP